MSFTGKHSGVTGLVCSVNDEKLELKFFSVICTFCDYDYHPFFKIRVVGVSKNHFQDNKICLFFDCFVGSKDFRNSCKQVLKILYELKTPSCNARTNSFFRN